MADSQSTRCLFLPGSAQEIWAVPQSCLAEIITLYNVAETPPATVSWRGVEVPLLDLDEQGETRWRDVRAGTGLVAILLGVEGRGCPYFAIALRGQGLGLQQVPVQEMEDKPGEVLPRSLAAFRWNNVTYQVPDLLALQDELGSRQAALSAEEELSAGLGA
ncbi:hypothetical protein [Parahaliea aestuarii]|uniref:Chemotaxis protein CheW n=1 Tax=Parahaliea aestuarii TaxID=1852021 RepID=A0A5C8ZYL2_9GAMM|nr:hypothetical protein [Parahaliea aestuarii]TXS92341.1 hypothetical protein FVW59_07915 [Parahaliea aestuarii]